MIWSAPALYALFAALLASLAVVPQGSDAFQIVLAGSFLTVQVAGLGFCLYAARHPRLRREERRPWAWLTAWFLLALAQGAALSASNPSSRGFGERFSTPLTAELVVRVLTVPVLVRALTAFLTVPLSRDARSKLSLDVMTVVGAAVMVIWYLVVGPSLFQGGATAPAARLFVVVFPVTDAILLLTVVTVLMHGTVTSARRSLLLLLVGQSGNLTGDLWLTYHLVFRPEQELPRLQIIASFGSACLLAAAAVERCRDAGERRGKNQQRVRAYTTLPYVALAGGYALLVVAAVHADVYPWAGLVGGALIMTTGVAGRQLVSLRENHRLVVTDPLTGLANRLFFTEQLTRGLERSSTRNRTAVAVLHIDLDDFKEINDTHGHETGDRILAAFGTLVAHSVRRTDTAARLGGDEFGVVLLDLADQQDAIDVARRLLDQVFRNPVVVAGEPHRIRCSIGVAYHDPRDLDELDDEPVGPELLLEHADQAMALAKRDGQAGWALYNERVAGAVVPPQRRHSDTSSSPSPII